MRGCHGTQELRLAEALELADGAHGPVLQISKKQNRELPYASCVRASRIILVSITLMFKLLLLTARQYGEVVLPDAASGNCPGTRR